MNRITRGPWFSKRSKEDACSRHVYWASYCDACRDNLIEALLPADGEVSQNA